uniref:Uncharacterized protein n=1 Tax=Chromera velia CCMP2878 TaxID=1169474 RepID=A0A0G4GHT8_9ALVE|eukprot:Cvel_4724.t1-p1 / transcript=Cvel_4724.t1 / gene=Cvel_4724 / organism=Chromera_velia_CCMP2878 / gene_product=hypothetical protein / transcript_product=hypothetical protein / location=Cvel_scaffold210:14968-15699(-) / protein_length=244 / sequence_SO=supercontig / SO=protein_coding / is_pseudo=false
MTVWMCCCPVMSVKVTGLPPHAQPLSPQEKNDLLAYLQGNWKIQPIQVPGYQKNMILYENAMVSGGQYTLTGGFHNETRSTGGENSHTYQVTVANKPKTYDIVPFRSRTTGFIYVDNIGSCISDVETGQVTLIPAVPGAKLLWQREWKRGGFDQPASAIPPPYSLFGHVAPTQQGMPMKSPSHAPQPQTIQVNIIGATGQGTPPAAAEPPKYDSGPLVPPAYSSEIRLANSGGAIPDNFMSDSR